MVSSTLLSVLSYSQLEGNTAASVLPASPLAAATYYCPRGGRGLAVPNNAGVTSDYTGNQGDSKAQDGNNFPKRAQYLTKGKHFYSFSRVPHLQHATGLPVVIQDSSAVTASTRTGRRALSASGYACKLGSSF